MSNTNYDNVVRHQTAASALRDHFLQWQCKARQNSVRKNSGKPSDSMCPSVVVDNKKLTRIIVILNKLESHSVMPELKHMVLQTQDPKKRYENALKLLSAEYYQRVEQFSDQITALFGPEEPLVSYLEDKRFCTLEFDHTRQYYSIPCQVTNLSDDSYLYQATYWHNKLFNFSMPPDVQVLAFKPDWSQAAAKPEPV